MAVGAQFLRLAVVCLAVGTQAYRTGVKTQSYGAPVKHPFKDVIEASKQSQGGCEAPPSPNSASTSCRSKQGSMQCTATCMLGFEFPDGRREMTLFCDRDRSEWQPLPQFPDCEGVCNPPCLNGGRCFGNNRCVCASQFRGDYCQYSIDLCNGHSLGFGGSWQCNHTHQETICKVSCPSGFRFQYPAADVYRCSPQGIWSPANVPICVSDDPNKYILSGGSLETSGIETGQAVEQVVLEHQQIAGGDTENQLVNQEKVEQQHLEHIPTSEKIKGGAGSDLPPEVIQPPKEEPPRSSGVCSTWGRFQFKSFDGIVYRFAGSCSYVLLRDCDRESLFSIDLEHSRGCPDSPDCSRTLRIFDGGKHLSIPLGVSFPSSLFLLANSLPGLSPMQAGKYVVLQSLSGYTLWLDENSVQVRVTPALRTSACGLCGRFDGDPSNDLVAIEGGGSLPARDFAISWALEKDCMHDIYEKDACDAQSKTSGAASLTAFDRCSIIFNDIYKECHEVIKPNRFFEACKQDCCDKSSPEACECSSLEEYFRECQRLGANMPESWRRETVCPQTCRNGTVYRECGPACTPTCSDREPTCPVKECVSGCHCPDGWLWHQDRCVAPNECTCSYRDREYATGDQIDQDCNSCVCNSGEWVCTDKICEASCSVLLGTIYTTFDGHKFETRGHCAFILLQTDQVRVIQDRRTCSFVHSEVPCMGDLLLQTSEGLLIKINQELQVTVNGREVNSLPAVFPSVTVTKPTSFFIEVEVEGLTVLTDGKDRLVLTANAVFYSRTMGLCGTFNRNTQDDFTCPGGDVDYQVESFVRQWADNECTDVRPVSLQCDESIPHWKQNKMFCQHLYEEVFSDCHSSVPVDAYFELCLQAACGCASDSRECICPVLSHYAHACSKKGVVIEWRHRVPQCGVSCEVGQYHSCSSVCDSSCALISRNTSCASRCVEGCACGAGLTLNRQGHCVPVSQCGCAFNGHEYPTGFKQRRHLEHCECLAGKWHCRPASTDDLIFLPSTGDCKANEQYTECLTSCPSTCSNLNNKPEGPACHVEICQAGCQCRKGFVRNEKTGECVPPALCPCHHGSKSYVEGERINVDCNQCTCQGGRWLCTQEQCSGTCALWGDSHVRTFDNVLYDFQGNCDYVLAKGRVSGNAIVSIVAQNVPCGRAASCAKAVIIKAGSEELVLTEGHPVPPLDKGQAMSVRSVGLFVVVHVTGGLSVYWDKHTRVYVVADSTWAGRLQGLCGNFNGDGSDEFRAPSGGPPLPDVAEFVNAWKLHSHCATPTPQQDGCLAQPQRKHWASSKCAILKQPLFEPCHSEVDVLPFYERCVSDTCACDTGGDCECLCTSVAAYAHECSSRGVHVLWRSQELCPVQCEKCDEYSACVRGCPPPNCEHPNPGERCPLWVDNCLEGCSPAPCPKGQVHRNETDHTCVPLQDCGIPPETGCNIGGLHFNEGQRVATPNACQSCYCHQGEIKCIGRPCPIEIKACTESGWSDWYSMTAPEDQRGNDFEILLAHGDHCPVENMVDVECRTVRDKTPWNETDETLLCSADTGLRCLRDDQDYRRPCSDYEMRVYCDCGPRAPPTTTELPAPTPIISVCPPGSTWSECGIQCNTTCEHFLWNLRSQGYCVSQDDFCAPSCISSTCKQGELRFDQDTCVPTQHCPCVVPETGTPVAPGEVLERGCERCQCAFNRLSCSVLKGCGTEKPEETTTISPTSTWAPEPEGGCWTSWINSGTPSGPGDFEDIYALKAQGKICHQPVAINCRTTEGETDWTQSGQKLHCSLSQGLQCWNSDNSPASCLDYEVRFYCPCEETTPQPTTVTPELPCEQGWSSWLNSHPLDDQGDLESLQSARDAGLLTCPTVTGFECREAGSHVGWSDTGLVGLKCDLSTGLVCRNKGQPKGRQCTDFQVRFFCDCGFPTTLPASPTTPVPTPAIEILSTRPPCAYWSNWIDKSHPGRKGHDDELELGFQHHKELNEFCKEGLVAEAECVVSKTEQPYTETGQVGLSCSPQEGFYCRDQDQSTGLCLDYKIRFYCSCEEATPTPLVVVTAKPTPHPSCSSFIRLVDGPEAVLDSKLSASSSVDSQSGPQAARFARKGSWIPNLNRDEWVQVELKRVTPVYGFQTKGDAEKDSWVTSYNAMYSEDGVTYSYVTNADGTVKAFTGNHDSRSEARQVLQDPFSARFVRLLPLTWEGRVALKFDLLGCAFETFTVKPVWTPENMAVCRDAMGLKSGEVADSQLEASSYRDEEHAAHFGRIGSRAWVAGVSDRQQYFQVDFIKRRKLTGVITQGRPEAAQWVKSFIVQYSNRGDKWTTITDNNGIELVFSGNYDSATPVTSLFPKAVDTRYLRIVPVAWKNWIALQLEVLGCPPPTEPTTTLAPLVEIGFRCPEPNGLFPDPETCRMFYHCSNDEPHHKWCPGDLHFNPKLLVCDWPENAGCRPGVVPVPEPETTTQPATAEPCFAYGPWISTMEPSPESEGDIEEIGRVIQESGLCRDPVAIECREYTSDADFRFTGQRVTCDLERGLRCLNHEQTAAPCLNYKVRVKCWTCGISEWTKTETPSPPTIFCPELSAENRTGCVDGCEEGFACDGERCVHQEECPCVRDGKQFPVGGILETRSCHECQCHLGGRSSCLPKTCAPCPKGRPEILRKDCSCDCGSCPEGEHLCPTSGECLLGLYWCDGVVHCPDDEIDCIATEPPTTCPPPVKKFCGKGQALILERGDDGCECYTCESKQTPIIVPPPPIKASCELVGHHFNTFDDREFDYSYCSHILLQDVTSGNIRVSVDRHCALEDEVVCPKKVYIQDGTHRITLYADLNATVNGHEYSAYQLALLSKKTPEFELEKIGDQIYFRSRLHALQVKLNLRGRIHLEVESSMKESLGGLCGYFNGDPVDDYTTPTGVQVTSANEFGDSWIVPGTTLNCAPFSCPKEKLLEAARICNKLRDAPLNECPGIGDQLANCLSATCECLQRGNMTTETCACDAYLDAVTQCQQSDRNKQRLQGWRLEYGCVPDCPPDMEWLDCGPDCQLTCENFLSGEVSCATKDSCNPGCFCPPGTVLDRDICKKADECADKVCTGYGDPIIETFDGWKFHLQSNGHFDLVSDTEGRFTVDGITGKCEERLSCIVGLDVAHGDHLAKIRRYTPAFIDGKVYQEEELPWTGEGLTIFGMPGKVTVVLFKDLGVQIRYNEISAAFSIHVPSKTFFNKTAGLCGNCNNQPDDDLKKKDGNITTEIIDFICSWETQLSEEECIMNFTGGEPEKPPPPGACLEMLNKEYLGQCLPLVDVTKFIDQCRHDVSQSVQEDKAICSSLVEYAHACCRSDVKVDSAWIQTFCNVTCPGDTFYVSCHDACPQSCDAEDSSSSPSKGTAKGHYQTSDCRRLMVDGCFCPDGHVFQEGTCKPRSVCDVCDDEGHKLGDEWKPDLCTSCSCKSGGKIDCKHEVCPPDPVCRSDQKIVRVPGADHNQCCDDRYCQDVLEECPELTLPHCDHGDVAKTKTDQNGCPVYFCECDPALCPPVVWPRDLEIGQEVVMSPVGCCSSLKPVCFPEKCPPAPQCPENTELVATPGACCNNYKCKAPEGVCLYTHQYDIVDGSEVAIPPANQNVSFYKADSVWRDGLCRNCSCDGSGSQFMARCTLETCYESTELPDDMDYFLTMVNVPNRCCPTMARLFCKDEYGNIREPGDEWQARGNQCKSHICEQTPAGEVHKVERSIICPKCAENTEELPPAPGECCPRCQTIACEEAGVMHPVGSHWNSSTHKCYSAECVRHGESVRVVYTSPACAPVSKNCPKDQVVWDDRRCCQKCNVKIVSEEACSPVPVKPEKTLKMFQFEDRRWGMCSNLGPAPGATECAGTCESHAYFPFGESNDVRATCNCCTPSKWEHHNVTLTCRNGKTLTKTFQQPTACHCAACSRQGGEREVEIIKSKTPSGIKTHFSNEKTRYSTFQGDQPKQDMPERISQDVQEPYMPEDKAEKPGKLEPVSQIRQEPYRPDVPETHPQESGSTVVQEPYRPEDVGGKPVKLEPISQIAQEPYRPEDVGGKPVKLEPIIQIAQEPYRPEDVPEPRPPEASSQVVQEPYRPDDATEKPGEQEPINQIAQEPYRPEDVPEPHSLAPSSEVVQEPYRPEDATEKPGKPEPISQIAQEPHRPEDVPEPRPPGSLSQVVQEPYRPEDATEKPGEPETISQIAQKPYRPEDVPDSHPPEPPSQVVQEPYRPEDTTEKPGTPEPVSQIAQEPYRPEDVPEPHPPEPSRQVVQQPYRPEDATEKPGKPEPISQIVQEPYRPGDIPEPHSPESSSQAVQEPYRPEDVTERPGEPEHISQIAQEPYSPEDIPEPHPSVPSSEVVQEPYIPEDATKNSDELEAISQIAQEPYRPEDIPEPHSPAPSSQVVQEPYRPGDTTEKPGTPEPISQIAEEPYRPGDIPEPHPAEPSSHVVQEPYRPEDATERTGRPETISQIAQEPYRPEDVPEPHPPEPSNQVVQQPYTPEDATEKPSKPEPISQIVQEPYRPGDIPEPQAPEPLSQVVQEPYRPEDTTEKTGTPEPISQMAQEPYRPEDIAEPHPPEPSSQVVQESYRREGATETPGKREPISQNVQEPYRPDDIPEPHPSEPSSEVFQEPYTLEDATDKPGKPEPISQIAQKPYRPEDIPEPQPPEPSSQVFQELYRPGYTTKKPGEPEPISQIAQEPYRPEDVPEPHPPEPSSQVVQVPYRPEDTTEKPGQPEPISQIAEEPYRPEDAPEPHPTEPPNHAAQEHYRPEDAFVKPGTPEAISQIAQEPYRPDDVPEQRPLEPSSQVVQEPYRPEGVRENPDKPEPFTEAAKEPEPAGQVAKKPKKPKRLRKKSRKAKPISEVVQETYRPEDLPEPEVAEYPYKLNERSHIEQEAYRPEDVQ